MKKEQSKTLQWKVKANKSLHRDCQRRRCSFACLRQFVTLNLYPSSWSPLPAHELGVDEKKVKFNIIPGILLSQLCYQW